MAPATKSRNHELRTSGVMRYSRSTMNQKTGKYRKSLKRAKVEKPTKAPARMVVKDIGGDKNGKTRTVRVNRMPKYYPTEDRPHKIKTRKNAFHQHKRSIRASITPGTVLILVAGRHKGKRVVFLKQLSSGLLLVTGPFKINGVPLRRINQIYVIATKTKVDLGTLTGLDKVNDEMFKRQKLRKSKKSENIFDVAKESYTVNDERKELQKEVDTQVLDRIRSNPEKKLLFGYLGAMFSLKNHQHPHEMVF